MICCTVCCILLICLPLRSRRPLAPPSHAPFYGFYLPLPVLPLLPLVGVRNMAHIHTIYARLDLLTNPSSAQHYACHCAHKAATHYPCGVCLDEKGKEYDVRTPTYLLDHLRVHEKNGIVRARSAAKPVAKLPAKPAALPASGVVDDGTDSLLALALPETS